MIRQLTFGAAMAAFLAAPAHAQGWAQALTALGAFSQGVQNGEAQRYNMQHGYPAQIQPYGYGDQSQSQWGQPQSAPYYIFNNSGRTVTCIPLGSGFVSCN
jgi:hypothetical protein